VRLGSGVGTRRLRVFKEVLYKFPDEGRNGSTFARIGAPAETLGRFAAISNGILSLLETDLPLAVKFEQTADLMDISPI